MVDPLIAAMIAYFVITILIAWWYGRGAGAGYVEFTLAGKNLSLIPFTMTYFATFVGGGSRWVSHRKRSSMASAPSGTR